MNNIKKLIVELKLAKLKAARFSYEQKNRDEVMWAMHRGQVQAFNFSIKKLTLLLKDESKQPQPPDFANTVLGEVPPVVKDGTEEHRRAVEGATPVVRQNEQTKEVNSFKCDKYHGKKCSKQCTTCYVKYVYK